MTAQWTFGAYDLDHLLAIIKTTRTDVPDAGLPWSLITDLKALIPSDVVTFYGCDSYPRSPTWVLQQTTPDDTDEEVYWAHFADCPPCCYAERGGDLREVIRFSDFYRPGEWRNTGIYRDYYRVAGIEHSIMLFLPVPGRTSPHATLRMFFHRGRGPDFSERDRAMLTLLRPHLHQAYLDAERARGKTPELTARQQDLLRLIAAGHTNAQIARRLGLAEGTVRKHLEILYAKLQVSSRTAALTRAFPQGLGQAPPGWTDHSCDCGGLPTLSRSQQAPRARQRP